MTQNAVNLDTAPFGIPVANATGNALTSTTLTNGQVLIGATGSAPVAATLTAGSNVTIVNGPGSVTINATGGTGFDAINIENITSSGTYTPPANLAFIVLEAIGGGGAGGGAPVTNSDRKGVGGGGGAGAYGRVVLTAAQVGASATVTIGAGAVGTGATGTSGGTTSFVCTAGTFDCSGGAGGQANRGPTTQPVVGANAGAGGDTFAGAWDVQADGNAGGIGTTQLLTSPDRLQSMTGFGGGSYLGGSVRSQPYYGAFSGLQGSAGLPAVVPGSGGGGAYRATTTGAVGNSIGGNGAGGIIIITEYLLP
jgi:hypothetical protein